MKTIVFWVVLLLGGALSWGWVIQKLGHLGYLHAQARALHARLTETLSPQDMARLEEAIATAESTRTQWLVPEASAWADDAVASAAALDALRREGLDHEVRLNLAGGLGLAPRPLARIEALRGTLRRIIESGVTAVHDVAVHPQSTPPPGWQTLRVRVQGSSAALGGLLDALDDPSVPGVLTALQVSTLQQGDSVDTPLEILLYIDLPLPREEAQP